MMTTCKKDNRLPHQKSRFFIANKGVGLSLDVWHSRKAFKSLLYTVYMPAVKIYYIININFFFVTAVDGSIFKKLFKTYNLRDTC